jgi:hypothetical protein
MSYLLTLAYFLISLLIKKTSELHYNVPAFRTFFEEHESEF